METGNVQGGSEKIFYNVTYVEEYLLLLGQHSQPMPLSRVFLCSQEIYPYLKRAVVIFGSRVFLILYS